ncbi:hypothetical protein GCM10009712_33830 [Pseudarthrobacter sulfonivorans]|uniref:hypothetical protein n=1 Tax=Pseudarthrobacter sulfonivorans TaxID=121292 RepID=UPI00168BC3FD|nr:hypothetical protein [Pseudarthrobacter sulfonivorans]
MSTQAERRQAELRAKIGLLHGELEFWQGLSSNGGVLEKHHSQLLRLGHMLDSALTKLDGQCDAVESWASMTEILLGIHHVWDFFRSKLALRLVDRFQAPLIAADELAWACVSPLHNAAVAARKVSADDVRQPPLVYFDSSGSPFALGRRHAYRNLLPARWLSDVPGELVKQLPVPVIGIPWHQQAHLLETAIIAHEAAHIADDDLRLTEAVLPLLDEKQAMKDSLADWTVWFPEVLADVLAAVWLGPAYGQALADLITALPPHSDPQYPPVGIRLQIVAETLQQFDHPASPFLTEAEPILAQAVTAVVTTIVTTPLGILGDAPLSRFEPFTAARQEQADADAGRLRYGVEPVSTDSRLLIAAGIQAFVDEPELFVQKGTASFVFTRIKNIRDAGIRGADGEAVPTKELESHDHRLGDDLFRLLAQARTRTAGSPSTT